MLKKIEKTKKYIRGHAELVKVFLFYLSDAIRFSFYSATRYQGTRGVGRTYLFRKELHKLEKGLALPEMKPWFGVGVIKNLELFFRSGSLNAKELSSLRVVLRAYLNANENFVVHEKAKNTALKLLKSVEKDSDNERATEISRAGADEEAPAAYFIKQGVGCRSFLEKRRSVRDFKKVKVCNSKIEDIYCLSSKAPTVCNRQTTKPLLFNDKKLIDKVLSLQNGNAGFRDKIYNLALVVADQQAFVGARERNQPYIDGGIMVTYLLAAIHNCELVSCTLNWSSTPKEDSSLRDLLGLGKSQIPIAFIAFGYPQDVIKYAISERQ